MVKCICFDMDGVLLDSEVGAFEIMRKTLSRLNVELDIEELLKYIGKTSAQIANELVAKYNMGITGEQLRDKYRETGNFYADSDDVVPMPGLVKFLEVLRMDGVKTAVVSSTSSKNVITALNRMGIVKYFDAVICGDMVTNPKPDPEGYLKAAKLVDVLPNDCLVIEDSPHGISAGIAAGMTVVGFSGSEIQQDISRAAMKAASFDELLCMYKNGSLMPH
ncbi:MAG: HAD family phosphatase [Clostridia bacterium]|nr:HAD family phosphatase [Clostridia bacterium]